MGFLTRVNSFLASPRLIPDPDPSGEREDVKGITYRCGPRRCGDKDFDHHAGSGGGSESAQQPRLSPSHHDPRRNPNVPNSSWAKPGPKSIPPPPPKSDSFALSLSPQDPGFSHAIGSWVFWDEDWSVRGARVRGLHLPPALLH